MKVELLHRTSNPRYIWCIPIGWTPSNYFEGWEFSEGIWCSKHGEEAGIACHMEEGGDGDIVEVSLDSLVVLSSYDCRFLGKVSE